MYVYAARAKNDGKVQGRVRREEAFGGILPEHFNDRVLHFDSMVPLWGACLYLYVHTWDVRMKVMLQEWTNTFRRPPGVVVFQDAWSYAFLFFFPCKPALSNKEQGGRMARPGLLLIEALLTHKPQSRARTITSFALRGQQRE